MQSWLRKAGWKGNERGGLRYRGSGIAGEERGSFDDGVGKETHGADKGFDEARIELRAGATFEFGESFLGGAAFLVAAVAGDSVVGVGDGDDAGTNGDVLAGEGVGIAGTIEEFVVV